MDLEKLDSVVNVSENREPFPTTKKERNSPEYSPETISRKFRT